MNRACFPKEKTPELTKMGEIHELYVLALSLDWFARATPDNARFLKGGAFLLTAHAFLLRVELLCLQSAEVRFRHTFPL